MNETSGKDTAGVRRASWRLQLLATMIVGGAGLLTLLTSTSAYQACWGDVDQVAHHAANHSLDGFKKIARQGKARPASALSFLGLPGSDEMVAPLEHLEIHYVSRVLHKGSDIGGTALFMVDTSSCTQSKVLFDVLRFPPPYDLWVDGTGETYRLTSAEGDLSNGVIDFRRAPHPSHRIDHCHMRIANLLVLLLAAASVRFGWRRAGRARGSKWLLVSVILAMAAGALSQCG